MQKGPIYTLDGRTPRLGSGVFVAPTAAVIGHVTVGVDSSIWFSAVVRGDEEPITIGAGTNIQDSAVIHSSLGDTPTVIGDNVSIGHGAILHGCRIEDGALVGMGAVVLDGAVVGAGAMVAAGALVPPGKVVPPGELWVGRPGAVRRDLSEDERGALVKGAADYRALAQRHLASRIGRLPAARAPRPAPRRRPPVRS